VEIDEHETEQMKLEWDRWTPGTPLEMLPSPFRDIKEPIHRYVRSILDAHPQTFVTLVIPEFIVRKGWHQLMHNQTPLMLKGAFLFEPSVVVSAVPYKL